MNLLRFTDAGAANVYATFIQATGLWMFGFLLVILARAVRRDWFDDFAKSFVFLAVAVSSLRVAFTLGSWYGRPFFISYFVGEYLFLLFLTLGARRLAGPSPRPPGFMVIVAFITVAILLSLIPDFSAAFVFQAGIMAIGLFTALAFTWRSPQDEPRGLGLTLLRFSLMVLGVGFAQYVPVLGSVLLEGQELPEIYSAFMSIFDLLFESLLAFAMIVTGMESVQRELVRSNEKLEQAKQKLDVMARTDPLTELLNRHAFAAVLDAPRDGAASGTLAVLDLDGLKGINDAYGHGAGDQAIRAFASALRKRLRADDLIFRWGGDEFLVVMFGLSPSEVTQRFESGIRVDVAVDRAGGTELPVSASFGVAPFNSIDGLRAAAEIADALMYEAKRARSSTPRHRP